MDKDDRKDAAERRARKEAEAREQIERKVEENANPLAPPINVGAGS